MANIGLPNQAQYLDEILGVHSSAPWFLPDTPESKKIPHFDYDWKTLKKSIHISGTRSGYGNGVALTQDALKFAHDHLSDCFRYSQERTNEERLVDFYSYNPKDLPPEWHPYITLGVQVEINGKIYAKKFLAQSHELTEPGIHALLHAASRAMKTIVEANAVASC